MTLKIISTPSPNFNDRAEGIPLSYIVLHYTGMKSAGDALRRMQDKASEVSAHYMIDEDGTISQLVAEDKRAWHAGKSFWAGMTDLNSASIGIELVNPGHQEGYRSFPAAQITALTALLRDILGRYPSIKPHTGLLAHSDVAIGRKEDPGELFPWDQLAKAGFGLWPQPRDDDYMPANDQEVQAMLREIGYDCPSHGEYDRAMRNAILAFQRHYEPNNMTGTPERETIARLRVVVKQVA